jgi:hypothetical protein
MQCRAGQGRKGSCPADRGAQLLINSKRLWSVWRWWHTRDHNSVQEVNNSVEYHQTKSNRRNPKYGCISVFAHPVENALQFSTSGPHIQKLTNSEKKRLTGPPKRDTYKLNVDGRILLVNKDMDQTTYHQP